MIPQLATALSSGFTSKQIVNYLLRNHPQHAKVINKALRSGFTADQIIKFLSGGRKSVNSSQEGMTEHEKTLGTDIQRREDVQQGALNAALAAGSLYATPIALRAGQAALGRALPPIVNRLSPAIQNAIGSLIPGQGMQPGQQGQSPLQQQTLQPSPQQPPISPSVAQPTAPLQPEVKTIDIGKLVEKHGLAKHIDEVSKNQKDPKAIAAILYAKFPQEMKAFQAESGKNMEDAIEDYLSQSGKVSEEGRVEALKKFNEIKKPSFEEKEIERFEKEYGAEEKPAVAKIEKSSIVASPQGVGEVKEIRNGKALVEVDGKLHKVSVDELEPPAFTDEETADAYDNLMEKIPEEYKSGFISWAGYDENRNVLGFIPRGGKYEELENVTPEEAEKIKTGKGVARTTGETREGLWVMGEDTRGGIISQIIHDRKKKHKAAEEKQLKLGFEIPKGEKEERGMKPIFDELAYAREKSREREKKILLQQREKKKKEKEEEKVRLKKERDEAKKRKKQT